MVIMNRDAFAIAISSVYTWVSSVFDQQRCWPCVVRLVEPVAYFDDACLSQSILSVARRTGNKRVLGLRRHILPVDTVSDSSGHRKPLQVDGHFQFAEFVLRRLHPGGIALLP